MPQQASNATLPRKKYTPRDDFGTVLTSSNTVGEMEFDQLFDKKEIEGGIIKSDQIVESQKYFLWSLKRRALQQCDVLFMQLPSYADAIDKICKLAINKGAKLLENSQGKEIENPEENEDWQKFLSTIPDGQFSFFHEVARILRTKSNLLVSLVDTTPDIVNPKDKTYMWVVINPENFAIIANSDDHKLAKYLRKGYLLTVSKDNYEFLDPNFTFFLKSEPSSILGMPRSLLGNSMSNAIVEDVKRFYEIKKQGGTKKQIANAVKIEAQGENQVRYRALDSAELTDLKKETNQLIRSKNEHIKFTDAKLEFYDVLPMAEDEKFEKMLSGVYALHIAHLAGIAPYKLLPPSAVNRSTMEQQYKEMIQDTVLPLNTQLTKLIQDMYRVWSDLTGAEKLKVTIENPLTTLDIEINAIEVGKAVDSFKLTVDEGRNIIGQEPASDELRELWNAKLQLQLLQIQQQIKALQNPQTQIIQNEN